MMPPIRPLLVHFRILLPVFFLIWAGKANAVTAPAILTGLIDKEMYAGDYISLSISASGSQPLTYVWKKDNVAIDGAVHNPFLKANASLSDAGLYTVEVSNAGGTVSSSARLFVVMPPPPSISVLASITVDDGDAATLRADFSSAAVDSTAVQWYKNGLLLPGATENPLVISTVSQSDAGSYKVVVSNAGGSATSNEAALTVVESTPPSASDYTLLYKAIEGTSVRIRPTIQGSQKMTYQWFKNGRRMPPSFVDSELFVQAGKAGTDDLYVFIATNKRGTFQSEPIAVHSLPPAPPSSNSRLPDHVYVKKFGSFTLNSQNSAFSQSVQWYRNGVNIAGDYLGNYSEGLADESHSGTYTLAARNQAGLALSGPVQVTVYDPLLSADSNQTPLTNAWLETRQFGDIVYLLNSTFIDRYDLAAKKWLPRVSLVSAASSFHVDAGGITTFSLTNIAKYSLTVQNGFHRVVSTDPLRGVMVSDRFFVASTDTEIKTYDRSTGVLLKSRAQTKPLAQVSAFLPGGAAYFSTSASEWSFGTADIADDGTVAARTNVVPCVASELQGFPQKLLFSADGSKVILCSGDVFESSTARRLGSIGAPFADAVMLDGKLVALAGKTLTLYDGNLTETAVHTLNTSAQAVGASGTTVVAFSIPKSQTDFPGAELISLDAFSGRPAANAIDPGSTSVAAFDIFRSANGDILLLDRIHSNLHRWSVSSHQYLPSIGLKFPIKSASYSVALDGLVYASGTGRIGKVSPADGADSVFISTLGTLGGVMAGDDFVLVSGVPGDDSYTRASTYDLHGNYIGSSGPTPPANSFVWNSAHRLAYFSSDSDGVQRVGWNRLDIGNVPNDSFAIGFGLDPAPAAPLRAFPDGSFVVFGSGDLYTPFRLEKTGALDDSFRDLAWLGNQMVTVKPFGPVSLVELRADKTFETVASVVLPGNPVRVLEHKDGSLVVITNVSDRFCFFILDSALKVLYRSIDTATNALIERKPASVRSLLGESTTFTIATVSEPGLAVQWYHDGVPIPGARGSSYTIASTGSVDTGSYYAVVGSVSGIQTSEVATLQIGSVASRLSNISTRAFVGTGENVEIAGFFVNGSVAKEVLVRAAGPSLGAFGLSELLENPSLKIYSADNRLVASNDDWYSDSGEGPLIATAAAAVGAFGWSETGRDAAVLIRLNPGAYTAIVSGADSGTGTALVEAYEIDRSVASNRLVNISTRSVVKGGANVLIAGIYISGDVSKKVLVRAVGPALGAFGVSGTLPDPVVEVYSGQQMIYQNDDWMGGLTPELEIINASGRVGAFALPNMSADSAMILSLLPGSYTIQVRGKNDAEGVALVEVFELP